MQLKPDNSNLKSTDRSGQGARSAMPAVKTDSLPRAQIQLPEADIEAIKSITRKRDPDLAYSISISSLALLIRHNSLVYRQAAAWALGIRGEAETASILATALNPRENWMVKREIVNSLGLKLCQTSIDALKPALKDNSHCVRVAAAKSLGKLKASSAKTELASLVKDDSEPIVRGAAIKALADIERAEQLAQRQNTNSETGSCSQ
ncbi:HEAT repeat-containing taxis proteinF [uncultured archaeon]|nr:HEAT repeat-containing taxis proteinF [uncultured archaeon]